MTMKETDVRVGERIRSRRQVLGKSQRVIAGQVGIDHTTLGRIERGESAADNRFVLARLAEALKCPVEYLTGVVVPGGKSGAETAAAVHDTIAALIAADLEFPPDGDLVRAHADDSIDQLTEQVQAAIVLRQACDYAALTRRLPGLVSSLYAATAGPDRIQALRLLVRIAETASFAVRYTGQPAGASIAADRARQAALLTEDPVLIAFGEWARAHAALGCGLTTRAALIAGRAAGDLERDPAGDTAAGAREMRGMLHLTSAFSLVGAGRHQDAADLLAEASVLARRTGETDTLALMFGPTNVWLWELAILTDGGDPLDAMAIARKTDPMRIPSASRQAVFYIDQGRCLGKLGETEPAVRAIEVAERIAPQRVHGDPLVIETVRGLLDQAHRRAAGMRLRALCERVGVAA